jgi:hypothetical protein
MNLDNIPEEFWGLSLHQVWLLDKMNDMVSSTDGKPETTSPTGAKVISLSEYLKNKKLKNDH